MTDRYIKCYNVKNAEKGKIHMPECKRCGSTQIVKSGMVREKQRYLCKKCGCHFVEGDLREKSTAIVPKALCTIFQALGAKQYITIGKFLKRDTSLIHRWMNKKPIENTRRWEGYAHKYDDIYQLFDGIKQSGVANGKPILMADNVIDDLYVALIVQRRESR